jgi:hypothetical protein
MMKKILITLFSISSPHQAFVYFQEYFQLNSAKTIISFDFPQHLQDLTFQHLIDFALKMLIF